MNIVNNNNRQSHRLSECCRAEKKDQLQDTACKGDDLKPHLLLSCA